MKQFNQWLLALVVMCLSLGSYAQTTCLTATGISENDAQSPSLTASGTPGDTAWYSFVPSANGFITISSCEKSNSLVDTRFFLYEGSCGALVSLGSSDNDCGLAALLNDVAVEAGKTYFIRWDNKMNAPASFNFSTSFRPATGAGAYANPVNDNICNAIALTLGNTVTGNNEDATAQGSAEHNLSIPIVTDATKKGWIIDRNIHNSIWYKFVAPTTGVVNVSAIANFDVQLALFAGNCTNIAGLSLLSASDDLITENETSFNSYCLTAGQTYYIMIDGFGTESGDVDVTVNSIDLMKPFAAVLATGTNPVNGALCPGANNWNLFSDLLVAADSSTIADADYVNSLKYSWKNGSNAVVGTSSTLIGVDADTYTLTITDTCGTTWTNSVTFTDTVLFPLDLVLVGTTNPLCVGAADGTVTVSHSGGFRFTDNSWDATDSLQFDLKYVISTTATNAQIAADASSPVVDFSDLSQLAQGSYRLYLTDACGSVDSVTFVLTDPASNPIQLDSIFAKNPICPGSATGSINLLAAGGEGKALAYEWSVSTDGGLTYNPTFITTQDLNGVTAGLYRVVVSDPCAHLANDTMTFSLVDPTVANLSYTSTQTNPTTFAAKNGAITLVVTGGLPNYNATWTVDGVTVPAFNNDLTLTNLPQGIYNVVVTDTCVSAGFIDTTFVLLAPIANDTACSAILINANDSLTTYHNFGANVTEGLVIPLNQDEGFDGWADVNINSSVWFKFVAPASGAVSLTASHYQGLNANLNFDPQIAVYSASNCTPLSGFSLLAANDNNFNGGAVNDSYLEVFCLTPGTTYYVLVDGYQGSLASEEGIFTLDLNTISVDPMTVNTNVDQPNCIDNFGAVSFDNVTGGIYRDAPESYSYKYDFNGTSGTFNVDNNGDVTAVNGVSASSVDFNNLTAGNYTLTISDTCGNSVIRNFTIAPIVFTPITMDFTLEQPYCPGDNDGEITFTLGGGGTPGTYFYEVRKGSPSNGVYDSDNYDHQILMVQLFITFRFTTTVLTKTLKSLLLT